MVIRPYRWEGMWVFDDEGVDLHREPFVSGADTLIDIAVQQKGIQNADNGFLMVFSATPFPVADFKLSWVRGDDNDGNYYNCPDLWDGEAWLCPALLKYFESAPSEIHVQVKPLHD